MKDIKLYLSCCIAGAYTVAVALALYNGAADKFYNIVYDFSFGALLSLLWLPVDALFAAFAAIPMAVLGLLAGIPGVAAGYVATGKLRTLRITGLAPWLGAGVCVGAANALVILLLIPERETAQVLGTLMTGAALTAFYIWRMDRERGYYN